MENGLFIGIEDILCPAGNIILRIYKIVIELFYGGRKHIRNQISIFKPLKTYKDT